MKKSFKVIGYTFLAVGAAMMVLLFAAAIEYNLNYPRYAQYSRVKRCMKGRFIVPASRDRGIVDVGQVEICGTDLDVSPVYGPSMETHIEQLRQENAFLRSQLGSCQEKQVL